MPEMESILNHKKEAGLVPWTGLICWAAFIAFFLLQFSSIYRETINWDEFALFYRARQSLDTGTLMGGGRPGLATILLMLIVARAPSEIDAIHIGRILWLFLTLGFISGTYLYIKAALKTDSRLLPFFGTALLVMNPFFIRSSVQVRTDQMAMVFSVFACICLLQSSLRWHMLAGILFGIAFLSSQKALYVMGIGLLVAYLPAIVAGPLRAKNNGQRLLVFGLLFGFITKGWELIAPIFFLKSSLGHSVGQQMNVFDYYSQTIGYNYYVRYLSFWSGYFLLGVSVLIQAILYLRARVKPSLDFTISVSILSLGVFVCLFHKGAFPYFLMVLGLFPAIGFSFFLKSLFIIYPGFFAKAGRRAGVFSLLFISLLGICFPHILAQQNDTQKVQRDSMEYVRNNFYGHYEGFQAEGALFLQPSKSPFNIYFSQNIFNDFDAHPEKRKRNIELFIRKFSENGVGFLVGSHRMYQFPAEIRAFWNARFVPWKASVYIAGAYLDSAKGLNQSIELIVPGYYVWIPNAESEPILLDGVRVIPRFPAKLTAGKHGICFARKNIKGYLILQNGSDAAPKFQNTFYPHGFDF